MKLFKRGLSLIPLLSVAFADECTEVQNELGDIVKCVADTEGNATELYAAFSNLEAVPEIVFGLKNLKKLNLSNNSLKVLPDAIGDLENLEELHLSTNYLETLPDTFGNLTNLKKLYMNENKFKVLPKSLFDLENLEILSLNSNNDLSVISGEIAKLQNLEQLYITTCLNVNQLPHEIVKLNKLETLDLRNSAIPIIPGFLAEMESLNYLYVYKNTNLNNFCISKKVMDSGKCYNNNYYYSTCDIFETCEDDKITFDSYKDVTTAVYFYNALKNKCLRINESSLIYGACDNSEETVWIIPNSHIGNYRSKANSDYCLSIEDGIVSLKECNDDTIIYGDGNFLKSSLYGNYCIGSSESDPNEVALKECNENETDQIWYFNNWDPSVVIEDTPVNTQPETVIVYFYNAMKNVCINSDGSSVTTGACDLNNNSLWEIPVTHDGLYRSKVDSEKCFSIIDGAVSLSECSEDTKLYRDGNFIKSPLFDGVCIDSNLSVNECDENNTDQIWYFNNWDPSSVTEENPIVAQPENVTVYFYNAMKNVCLSSDGTSITAGNCDFSDNSLWEIPVTHDGLYRLKANPEKCLSIVDGVIALSECSEDTRLYRDGNFIKSPLSDDTCISSDISIKECDANDYDQIWYFNNYDPSVVVEETPVVSQPQTVTIYFYNAYKNVCIVSDGSSVSTGECDFSDNSLWEIPVNHDGLYRLKANPEKCLSIIDGAVSISECNEDTKLYRDDLFIRSPLSDNYCISSARFSKSLEYVENCYLEDTDNIWYYNVWTAPVEETPVEEAPVNETLVEETPVNETPVEETPKNETPVDENPVYEIPEPTTTEIFVPPTEEEPTMTITTTFTEAY